MGPAGSPNLWTALGALALLSVMSPARAQPEQRPAEERCWLSAYETPVRCVTLDVPFSYEEPQGESLALTAVVVPAVAANAAPDALFVFAGGPGQAGRELGGWLNTGFREILRDRDVVFVDVRGTGRSEPLNCDIGANIVALTPEEFARAMGACAQRHGARARHHSAREIVQDVERLRHALGYEQISIWGGSFGTRVAQHYARSYPNRVHAVILDAFSPAERSLFADAPRYAQHSLDLLFADCEQDTACHAAFPRLRQEFAQLLARAESAAITGTMPDPRTGEATSIRLDRDVVAGMVRGGLYADFTRSLVPLAIHRAAAGDIRPLMGLAAATASWSTDTMSLGMSMGYMCAEDMEQARRGAAGDVSFGFMRDSYFRFFERACAVWPYEPLPEEMLTRHPIDVPALVISGELDPITPTASGEHAFETFSSGAHVIVAGGQHTNSSDPCIARIMADFLRDPRTGGRDHGCLRERPHQTFLTSTLG